MKQNLKYCILIVLLILLYPMVVKAIGTSYTIQLPEQEECFISQARPNRDIIESLYYCAQMPCEIVHADLSHIPTDKSLLRLIACFRIHRDVKSNPSAFLLHLNIHSLSDPLAYYVYGLRKIII